MADTPLNPKTPITNGLAVSTANPLPCISTAAGASAAAVFLSPTTWVVNGDIVSTSNPLPITLS